MTIGLAYCDNVLSADAMQRLSGVQLGRTLMVCQVSVLSQYDWKATELIVLIDKT